MRYVLITPFVLFCFAEVAWLWCVMDLVFVLSWLNSIEVLLFLLLNWFRDQGIFANNLCSLIASLWLTSDTEPFEKKTSDTGRTFNKWFPFLWERIVYPEHINFLLMLIQEVLRPAWSKCSPHHSGLPSYEKSSYSTTRCSQPCR
jgi:hypothetical protein